MRDMASAPPASEWCSPKYSPIYYNHLVKQCPLISRFIP
jgi:hypothetical protein